MLEDLEREFKDGHKEGSSRFHCNASCYIIASANDNVNESWKYLQGMMFRSVIFNIMYILTYSQLQLSHRHIGCMQIVCF